MTAARDRLGHWTYFAYDELGRRTGVINALGQVNTATYCGCGSPETLCNAAGVTTMIYNNDGKLATTIAANTNIYNYAYDAAGRFVALIDPLGHSITNAYNNQGLVFAVSNAVGRVSATMYRRLQPRRHHQRRQRRHSHPGL